MRPEGASKFMTSVPVRNMQDACENALYQGYADFRKDSCLVRNAGFYMAFWLVLTQ
jgi:hypothetical protein